MRVNGSRSGEGKTALITGASGGIGYELALLFAADGFNCVLVARTRERLDAFSRQLESDHGIRARFIVTDLSKPDAVGQLMDALERERISVDILVNNAGFPAYGKFAELSLRTQMEMIQVNVSALTELTHRLLPEMLARSYGRILNVASTAAFQPGPLMAVYYATKAYVLSFSEAIREELAGTGIMVTALCPGPTRTGFQRRGEMEHSRLVQGEIMGPQKVALAGYRGLMAGKDIVIPGFTNKLVPVAVRLAPRSLIRRSVKRMQEPIR